MDGSLGFLSFRRAAFDDACAEDIDLSTHPNDGYFKAVFSDPAHAAMFFQSHLPPALVARIDWPSLKLVPGSYVKQSLQQAHSDLLFSASAGGRETLLYLLFEHQTTVDAAMPTRRLTSPRSPVVWSTLPHLENPSCPSHKD
jgi:predicted transposase YdaD